MSQCITRKHHNYRDVFISNQDSSRLPCFQSNLTLAVIGFVETSHFTEAEKLNVLKRNRTEKFGKSIHVQEKYNSEMNLDKEDTKQSNLFASENVTAMVGLAVGGSDEVDRTEESRREISRALPYHFAAAFFYCL